MRPYTSSKVVSLMLIGTPVVVCPVACLNHVAAELVVPSPEGRDREPMPKILGGLHLHRRARFDREASRFGPRHVHAIAHLEPRQDAGVRRLQQPAR